MLAQTRMKIANAILVLIVGLIILFPLAPRADAQEFKYRVQKDRAIGRQDGELIISPSGIEYRTKKEKDSRVWSYEDIKTIEIPSPATVRIWTYKDRAMLLGKDESLIFKILDSQINEEAIGFLRKQSNRPYVVSYSFADGEGLPVSQIAVKHLHRFGGCEGVLKIYSDRIEFATPDGRDSRNWLWSDIQSVGRPDLYRLDLLTYEPQTAGPQRSFNFLLKEFLSEERYDMIWNRVYKPRRLVKPDSELLSKQQGRP